MGSEMCIRDRQVALIDVVKGISMFKKVEIPILGVIENMAYFVCPKCNHEEEIFSRGGGKRLAEEEGTTFLGEIPIHSRVRAAGDAGIPVIMGSPDSEHARIFMDIAARVAGKLVSQILSGPRRSSSLVMIR